ncbi:MAG TPA: hypothetical protein VF333_00450 [Pyrinomonadaceae bacterium]
MSTLSSSAVCRRIILAAFLTLVTGLAVRAADAPNWAGEYVDKKFLNGRAVFQLSIEQSGSAMQVTFDAAYTDAHGAAPEGQGPAKISGNTLQFKFEDSFSNSGTGTITRVGDDIILSMKTTHVADPRCLAFYGQNMRLKRIAKK